MYLISYDIANDRLRLRVAKILLKYGLHRLQLSVFFGTLTDALKAKIQKELLDLSVNNKGFVPDDSIFIIPIDEDVIKRIIFLGKIPDRWDEMQGNLHTFWI